MALTEPYIFQLVCNVYNLDYRNPIFTLLAYAVPLGIAALWIYAFFSDIRSKRYTRLTGRKYESDHIRYKRSYTQLVDYFQDADSYQIDPDTLPQTSWKDAEGIILGRTKNGHLIHINSSKDGQITWGLGNPGVGKTTGPIITSAMRWGARTPLSEASQNTDGSVFCIDLKNDIWKATHKYRSIKRFNLMDPEHSCHFNPLNGIEELSIDDRCNFIENMAKMRKIFQAVIRSAAGPFRNLLIIKQVFFSAMIHIMSIFRHRCLRMDMMYTYNLIR